MLNPFIWSVCATKVLALAFTPIPDNIPLSPCSDKEPAQMVLFTRHASLHSISVENFESAPSNDLGLPERNVASIINVLINKKGYTAFRVLFNQSDDEKELHKNYDQLIKNYDSVKDAILLDRYDMGDNVYISFKTVPKQTDTESSFPAMAYMLNTKTGEFIFDCFLNSYYGLAISLDIENRVSNKTGFTLDNYKYFLKLADDGAGIKFNGIAVKTNQDFDNLAKNAVGFPTALYKLLPAIIASDVRRNQSYWDPDEWKSMRAESGTNPPDDDLGNISNPSPTLKVNALNQIPPIFIMNFGLSTAIFVKTATTVQLYTFFDDNNLGYRLTQGYELPSGLITFDPDLRSFLDQAVFKKYIFSILN